MLAALHSVPRADAADLLQAPARAVASTYLPPGRSVSPAILTRASQTRPAPTATHRPPGRIQRHLAMLTFLAVSAGNHWGPQQGASPCRPQRALLPKSKASPAQCRGGASSLNQSSRAGPESMAARPPAMRSLSSATQPLLHPAKRLSQQWLLLPLQQLLQQLQLSSLLLGLTSRRSYRHASHCSLSGRLHPVHMLQPQEAPASFDPMASSISHGTVATFLMLCQRAACQQVAATDMACHVSAA